MGSLGSQSHVNADDFLLDFRSSFEGITRKASEAASRALHHDEAVRAAAFARSIAVLALFTMVGSVYLGGPTWLVLVTQGSLAALLATSLWISFRAASPKTYTRRHFRVFAMMCALTSFWVEYYLGVFSPTPLVATLGISFLATGSDRPFAVGVPLMGTLG